MPQEVKKEIEIKGLTWQEFDCVDSAIPDTDVLYVTRYDIYTYTVLPRIVSSPWIVSSSSEETIQVFITQGKKLARKLYEFFKLLWIKKRIVAAATIWGNTVFSFSKAE